jgi:hypothetical protein
MTSPTRYPPNLGFEWRENWQERLYSLVRERGFGSVTAYADSRPGATLVELADDLGPGNVAPVQVEWRMVAEAEASNTIERCARSLLARGLRQYLPEGWHLEWPDVPGDPTTPLFRKLAAFGDVSGALSDAYTAATRRLRRAFDAADIPEGWLPTGPDDPVIVDIFRRHWAEPA